MADKLTTDERFVMVCDALMALTGKVVEGQRVAEILLGHVICLVDQLDLLKAYLQAPGMSPPETLGTLYPVDDRREAKIMVASQEAHGKPVSEFLLAVAAGRITKEMAAEELARKGED